MNHQDERLIQLLRTAYASPASPAVFGRASSRSGLDGLSSDDVQALDNASIIMDSPAKYARLMLLASSIFPWLGVGWAQDTAGHEIQHYVAAAQLGYTGGLAITFLQYGKGVLAIGWAGSSNMTPEDEAIATRAPTRLSVLDRGIEVDWGDPRQIQHPLSPRNEESK